MDYNGKIVVATALEPVSDIIYKSTARIKTGDMKGTMCYVAHKSTPALPQGEDMIIRLDLPSSLTRLSLVDGAFTG